MPVEKTRRAFAGTSRFRVKRQLGAGAVYEVVDGKRGASVALKVLAAAGGDVGRMMQELRALSTLKHPNLVHLDAFGRLSNDEFFFTMDLVKGQEFIEWVRHPADESARGSTSDERLR